jgi:hypothetical protein
MASNHFHVDGPSVFSSWPIDSWHERVHYSQPAGQSFEMNCQDNSQWQLMANNRNVIYRIENSQGDILNIGETNDKVESRMKSKFKENKFIRSAMEQDLYLRIMTPTNRRVSTKEAEAVYLNLFYSEHRRLPVLNSKKESPSIGTDEWSSGLRALARSMSSPDIGNSNTTRGKVKSPDQIWISSLQSLQPGDFEKYCPEAEIVYKQGKLLYFIGPTFTAIFKKGWGKPKFSEIAYHWDFFLNESGEIRVFHPETSENYPWRVLGDGILLYTRITDLALRTAW